MPEFPACLDRMKRRARGLAARVRPGHLAVAAVVAALGVGVAGLRAGPPSGPQPIPDGERIRIQVVDPIEPEILPGSVMDVGELVDGFVYTPPPRPVVEPVAYAPYDEEFEPPKPRSTSRAPDGQPVIHAPPQPEAWTDDRRDSRDDRVDRWFGFDAPDRDYRAEREARRARRDARAERDRDRREVRRYSSRGYGDRGD